MCNEWRVSPRQFGKMIPGTAVAAGMHSSILRTQGYIHTYCMYADHSLVSRATQPCWLVSQVDFPPF